VLLLSATLPSEVRAAAGEWLQAPALVEVAGGLAAHAISRTVTQVGWEGGGRDGGGWEEGGRRREGGRDTGRREGGRRRS
jgi:hypothetical protein